MGNRAVLTTPEKKIGIYVHWNGGRESVEGYLKAARDLRFRDPTEDEQYAMARLTGAICAFFGLAESTSVGIGSLENLDCDNWDNGVYVVGKGWKVVERYGKGAPEKAVENPDWELTEDAGYDESAKQKTDGIAEEIVKKCRARVVLEAVN